MRSMTGEAAPRGGDYTNMTGGRHARERPISPVLRPNRDGGSVAGMAQSCGLPAGGGVSFRVLHVNTAGALGTTPGRPSEPPEPDLREPFGFEFDSHPCRLNPKRRTHAPD